MRENGSESRARLQQELEARLRQQAAVAAMGQRALAGASFAELLAEIVAVVAENLDADFVGYLHCTHDPTFVQALAGVGWPTGFEHDGRFLPVVPGGLTYQALQSRRSVIVENTVADAPPSPILVAAGIRSSVLVPIHGERTIGLIGAHSHQTARFSLPDADFLAAAANVVAVAHGRLEAEATLRHRAHHDALTGLPNRVLLYDRLDHAIVGANRRGSRCALLLVDLDGFKEVNDTLGHPVGDALLQAVAGRLRGVLGPDATVARLGGDEFAMVLPDVDSPADAETAARRVLAALDDPPVVAGMPIPVGASVGIALAPDHGADASALLQRADAAMYRAKRLATRVQCFDQHLDGREPKRLARAGRLSSAIDDGELALAYQPKVSLPEGRVVGAEALLRWHHPEEGLLLPGEFLPLVEPTATILPLSRWVVHEAVRQMAQWRRDGLDLHVAVNCSARYLQSPQLVVDVLEALYTTGLPSDRLVLEITESALITNPLAALTTVGHLVGAGVRISIDDFGTGFASLAQLERFPAAEIKIDRRFVAGLGDVAGLPTGNGQRPVPGTDEALGRRREAIIQAVLDLGRSLDIDVVAEGIETQAALDQLTRRGCSLGQGYYFSRPVSAARFPSVATGQEWKEPLLTRS